MDRIALTQRLLLIYSGVLTVVLCVVLLSGAASPKKTTFDEIEVKRINLVEPDGTLRLVIADKANFPGMIVKGKEYPHDRGTAGMLFFNDEGTENGGLIFGGMKDKRWKSRKLRTSQLRSVHGRSGDGSQLRRVGGAETHGPFVCG
jgi:hypothetical protein